MQNKSTKFTTNDPHFTQQSKQQIAALNIETHTHFSYTIQLEKITCPHYHFHYLKSRHYYVAIISMCTWRRFSMKKDKWSMEGRRIKPSRRGFSWQAECLLALWWPAWHGWHRDWCLQTAPQGMPPQPPAMQELHGSGNADPSAYSTPHHPTRCSKKNHNIHSDNYKWQRQIQPFFHPHLEVLSNFPD